MASNSLLRRVIGNFTTAASAAVVFGVATVGGHCQGTIEDYARSASIGSQIAAHVYRANLKPHWLDDTHFWYRNDGKAGVREYIMVEAAPNPGRKPAFDHIRLAGALSKALNRAISADHLPVDNIKKDDQGGIIIQSGSAVFALSADYLLTPVKSDLGKLQAIAANRPNQVSRDGSAEANITFINDLGRPIRLFWVDSSGMRREYGRLTANQRRDMHTYAGHLWLVTDDQGTALVLFRASETADLAVVSEDAIRTAGRGPRLRPRPEPAAAPRYNAFIREFNIWLRDPSGKETQLTKDGVEQDRYENELYWSPDGTHLLAFRTVPEQQHPVVLVESSPSDQVQPKVHTNQYLKPGDRIAHPRPHLFDAAKGSEIPVSDALMSEPWSIDNVFWDADSSRVTLLYNQRGHQIMRVLGISAESGNVTTVIEEKTNTFIDWTNKVYFHRMPRTAEAIWMSERDGWTHLYLFDTRLGKLKNQITRGEWVVRGVDAVDEVKRQITFHVGGIVPGQDPYYIQYARINFDGSGLTLLTEGDGTHNVDYSPNKKFLIDTWSRVDLAPVCALRNAETGKKVLDIEAGDASELKAVHLPLPERFVAPGRDGKTPIYGVICRPSNYVADRKYPVIENIYAGPQGAFVPKAFSRAGGLQAIAELGFIVVQMDGMGTNFRSRAFHDVCFKNLADAGFEDRIAWIKAAAAKYPYMDLNRVGIYGTSAGGQNALGGLLLHGDFYKAGVADCGCQDNRMDKIWWNEQWMGWPVGPEYAASSNVTHAAKLSGKLLLMVGEMDTNVDPASTMQVVNALIRANKDFDLLVMPGAGHGVAGTAYGHRRLQDFFVKSLLGADPRSEGRR